MTTTRETAEAKCIDCPNPGVCEGITFVDYLLWDAVGTCLEPQGYSDGQRLAGQHCRSQ